MMSNNELMMVVKDIEFRLTRGFGISKRELAIYALWGMN